jgi:hypothetical protein
VEKSRAMTFDVSYEVEMVVVEMLLVSVCCHARGVCEMWCGTWAAMCRRKQGGTAEADDARRRSSLPDRSRQKDGEMTAHRETVRTGDVRDRSEKARRRGGCQ